jgi:hypothetical protein
MSTKTTFKRIALVAVAALGFGTLSVVPSSAVQLVSVTTATAAATGTTSTAARAVLSLNGFCDATGTYAFTNYISVWAELPATSRVGLPTHGALTAAEATAYSSATTNFGPTDTSLAFSGQFQSVGKQWIPSTPGAVTQVNSSYVYCNTVGRYAQLVAASFTPDVAGTYKIMTFDPANAATTQNFWTIVVTDPTVKLTKAFLNTDSSTALTADASSLVYTAAASTTAKGALTVQQYSTVDTTTVAATAFSQEVVVAIDKGLVSKTNDYSAGAKSVTVAAKGSTAGLSTYYVFSNGDIGKASLTVTVGGVLASTKAITFSGVATTLSAALTTGQKTWIAPLGTTTLTVSAKDSAGNAASNTPTITATSATTSVATVVATSNTLVTITGVAAGTSVITIADSATTSAATSTTYTVTVKAATTTAAATISFDKADYAPGELMTITVAADVADNDAYAAFTAKPVVSVSVVTVTDPFTAGAVKLVAGKATMTAYAPASGNVTITATSSAGPTTAAVVTATASVTNDALDAASEAIDAANAATDAANAAAEAADAATAAAQDAADAVAALSTSVSAMITALKKQITTLTNLVIKIQKKVKA